MEIEHDEKEFDDVVEILKRLYDGEKYWFDPDLINNTIKAFKEVAKIKCCECGSDEDLITFCDTCHCTNTP